MVDNRAQVAQAKIIKAARRLFLQHGFSGVSTALLAKEASTSKATLYKYFKDMSNVLEHVLIAEEVRIGAGVEINCADASAFIENLTLFGVNLLTFLNEPDIAKLEAVLAEHGKSSPALAEQFYLLSYGSSINTIQSMFEHAVQRGYMALPMDSETYAELFLSALEGFGYTRARFGVTTEPYTNPKGRTEQVMAVLVLPHIKKGA